MNHRTGSALGRRAGRAPAIATLAAGMLWLLTALAAPAQNALDLRNADLRTFVEIVSETTGRNFIIDPQVQGTVTVYAPNDVSPAAIYEIFLNILELNRLTIVEGAEADRIVPMGVARELAPGADAPGDGGAYETRVIRVRNVPLSEITEVIRPLLPQEAVLSTVPAAGLMILSDRRENFRKIEALVARLDQPRETPIETIRLNDANATELLGVIQALDITPSGASLSADRRANALIVSGPAQFRDRVRAIVSELDTPQRSTATRVVQLSYADAGALADVVLRTFAREGQSINVVAEPNLNALLVTAPPDVIDSIVSSVRNLDRRPSQVLVEAVIFEMSVESFADLSVQWGGILDNAIAGGVQFSLEGRPTLTSLITTVLAGDVGDPGQGGSIGGFTQGSEGSFGGFLSAVASKRSTRILSTPSVMTLNNQEAEIVVAQSVPFVTGSFATVGESAVPEQPFQTINREDVGLTLKVTPQITADDTVRMEIEQEVSNLTNASSEAGGEITSKRTLSTNVLVRNGRVIMLGGLLEDGSGSVGQRVPGISRLPLVGGLFRGRNAGKNQRVLLILIRPRIVRNDREAEKLTREVARQARRASEVLQQRPDGQYPDVPVGVFPFDGADLNQPFDAGFIDDWARGRNYPPVPSRLRFQGQ